MAPPEPLDKVDYTVRLQSSHTLADRALDAYFSPLEAAIGLLEVEDSHLPNCIWEPAAGDGALVRPLQATGRKVIASDISDYGLRGCATGIDYLSAPRQAEAGGIVTNPPYKLAVEFALKALQEAPYLALLLRTNFLESTARLPFFRKRRPARIWISSRRLPMMHRHGWEGPRAPSNTCFAWFIWDAQTEQKCVVDWFDWKQSMKKHHEIVSFLTHAEKVPVNGKKQEVLAFL
jgi:hypothetical protein